jgi:hypothetical protein
MLRVGERTQMSDAPGVPERLTRAQKITIWVTVALAVFSIVANILVREWYSPDLRYSVGDSYFLNDRVAFPCQVKNEGHTTAKNIRVYASFQNPLIDYQFTGDVSAKIISGGVGQTRLDLEIDRIVPDGHFTIFYALKQAQTTPAIEKIESDEGLATTGAPRLWSFVFMLPVLAFFLFLQNKFEKFARKQTGPQRG